MLKTDLTALVLMVGLDGIWLAVMGKFYKSEMGSLMADTVNWPAAVTFYLIFAFGLVYFVQQSFSRPTLAAPFSKALRWVWSPTQPMT